jgi:hypothetical protein
MFPRRLMHVPQAFDKSFLKLTIKRRPRSTGFSNTAYTGKKGGISAMFTRRLIHVPQAIDKCFLQFTLRSWPRSIGF